VCECVCSHCTHLVAGVKGSPAGGVVVRPPRLEAKKLLGILDMFEALRYRRERSKKTITEHDRSVSS